MRFEKLDLNLLVVLDALLETQSVSLAANQLNLSQSGASASLGRLREFFDDDLLVSSGRKMSRTPRADELVDPVKAALALIRETILTPPPFDPATSDRTITIASIDVVARVLLTRAVAAFAREAPAMRFKIAPLSAEPGIMLQRDLADIVVALDYLSDAKLPTQFLYEDDFVAIGWSGNSQLGKGLTSELYEALGHVSVHLRDDVEGFDEMALRRAGIQRRIEAHAPGFGSVPRFVIDTDRIATIHRSLAVQVRETLPIDVFELPFEFPKVREVAQWSVKNSKDEGVAWVVRRLTDIAAELAEPR